MHLTRPDCQRRPMHDVLDHVGEDLMLVVLVVLVLLPELAPTTLIKVIAIPVSLIATL